MRNNKNVALMTVIGLMLGSCTARAPARAKNGQVTLQQLIDEPRKFHEQRVAVSGYVGLAQEGGAVFVTEEDERAYRIPNAILLLPPSNFSSVDEVDGAYAEVQGVFYAENGEFGPWIGTIVLDGASAEFRFRPNNTVKVGPADPERTQAVFDEIMRNSPASLPE